MNFTSPNFSICVQVALSLYKLLPAAASDFLSLSLLERPTIMPSSSPSLSLSLHSINLGLDDLIHFFSLFPGDLLYTDVVVLVVVVQCLVVLLDAGGVGITHNYTAAAAASAV